MKANEASDADIVMGNWCEMMCKVPDNNRAGEDVLGSD